MTQSSSTPSTSMKSSASGMLPVDGPGMMSTFSRDGERLTFSISTGSPRFWAWSFPLALVLASTVAALTTAASAKRLGPRTSFMLRLPGGEPTVLVPVCGARSAPPSFFPLSAEELTAPSTSSTTSP